METRNTPSMVDERFPAHLAHGFHDPVENYATAAAEGEEKGEIFDGGEDVLRILREFKDEIDEKGQKIFEEIHWKLEKDIPRFERFLKKIPVSDMYGKLHEKLNVAVEKDEMLIEKRGVNGGFTREELRLERFKVKTFDIVVKEQEK